MASKYRIGQRFTIAGGRSVEVIGVRRSIHGNTSVIELRDSDSGDVWPRPVRTGWLTDAIARYKAIAVVKEGN